MSLENEQLSFDSEQKENKRVTVLGLEFENDDARREYFREELRKKLPELKKIEGFPIGEDEDIIALSDPPFYTACPNPWVNEIITGWETCTCEDAEHITPLAIDVSEGKSDAAYMAHAYHTKVPSRAIARYIEHFTSKKAVIFDGFSGSGMTGVGVQEANRIDRGDRKIVLNDLSTIATSITRNYNSPHDKDKFRKTAKQILDEVVKETEWMFETHTPDGNTAKINYVVWSEVFLCPTCSNELVYWDVAIDENNNKFRDEFFCPSCGTVLSKRRLERNFTSKIDTIRNENITTIKHVPVMINYSYLGKRYEKRTDNFDIELLRKIENFSFNNEWIPDYPFPKGDEIDRLSNTYGFTRVYQLYTKRALIFLSTCMKKARENGDGLLISWITSALLRTTKLYKFTLNRKMGTVSGTYYIPSLWVENTPEKLLARKISDISKVEYPQKYSAVINTGSQTTFELKDNSIDYVFTDPPFGENLMYSELNFVWESWLKVFTNNKKEAIMNKTQHKGLEEYNKLMFESFRTYYKVLKPKRWMTVVFSNSKASIWNVLQEAIQRAGFVIAEVSALDKKQGSFKAVTTTTAVKQDLVISAYKPSEENIKKMKSQRNSEESAWIFVSQHLSKLPIFIGDKGDAVIISERTPRILFDRMVAYHVQQGLPVPISSANFQSGIASRYPMRDGMAFLDSQVAEYDKKRILAKEFAQLSLFVSDENSAIEWIRQQLMKKPQSRQNIHPQFMKEIQHIAKYEELPELDELLAQNFLYYDGNGAIPNQISTYLTKNYHDLRGLEKDDALLREKAKNRWYVPNPNQQADLEKLREKNLLREFGHYLDEINNSKKKLKVFRTEAIRVGFKKAWTEKEYQTIVTVGERLPEKVIQEDDKLLMYYDNALMRTEM
ncbi:DNA methylase [Enterococcus avium]|uniref:DNA methylase n=1 Tax=Enterococcus avium TaxID=33945 RepID=UPI0022E1CC02|nr:DNA methylase [Enterococcus avium]MDT2394371.1 DNA methylase [Enterococcus avium]MDT2418799.1 DNA methylase [Enterococcus avium]MDT2431820.1 DNA methylase [Enterococcus avium]MDT2440658.1 DNA methylase [Enterococcus avium]MDT2453579.1 DNA methylase [Enterococcus avium]